MGTPRRPGNAGHHPLARRAAGQEDTLTLDAPSRRQVHDGGTPAPRLRRAPSVLRVHVVAVLLLSPLAARASERHFTYTYESAVLAPGEKAIDVWTTGRGGRDTRYTEIDERLQFGIGLLPGLETSVYLNFSAVGQELGGELVKSTDLSFSNEWRWRVLDATQDAVGLAFQAQVTAGVDAIQLQGKLVVDRRFGQLLLAANFVVEEQWTFGVGETTQELRLDGYLAGSWFFTPRFAVGLEAWNANVIAQGTWEHSAIFLGPVVSYSGNGWWMAFTFLPQLPAFKPSEGGGQYVLTDYERYQARLLFSFRL